MLVRKYKVPLPLRLRSRAQVQDLAPSNILTQFRSYKAARFLSHDIFAYRVYTKHNDNGDEIPCIEYFDEKGLEFFFSNRLREDHFGGIIQRFVMPGSRRNCAAPCLNRSFC
jgi:hypothetical protein